MKPQTIGPADDKMALIAIQAGLGPQQVEMAYRGKMVREVSTKYGIDQALMHGLAIRWGVVDA